MEEEDGKREREEREKKMGKEREEEEEEGEAEPLLYKEREEMKKVLQTIKTFQRVGAADTVTCMYVAPERYRGALREGTRKAGGVAVKAMSQEETSSTTR